MDHFMKLAALVLSLVALSASAQTVSDIDGTTWSRTTGSEVLIDGDAAASTWYVPKVNRSFRVVVMGCPDGKGRMVIRQDDKTKEFIWHYRGTTLIDRLGFETCLAALVKERKL